MQGVTTLIYDVTLTAAALDRLLQCAHLAQIRGENYWLEEKRKAGTKPATEAFLQRPVLVRVRGGSPEGGKVGQVHSTLHSGGQVGRLGKV